MGNERTFMPRSKFSLTTRRFVMKLRKPFLVAGIGMLALIPLACSKGGGGVGSSGIDPKSEGAHIASAALAVNRYVADTKKVPKSTSDMKDWAAKNNVSGDDLVSTRDKEPYQVHEVNKGPVKEVIITEATGVKGKKYMWTRRPGGGAPVGIEVTQEQIDSELKPSGAGRPGRPG
jgi:hypothetical protein